MQPKNAIQKEVINLMPKLQPAGKLFSTWATNVLKATAYMTQKQYWCSECGTVTKLQKNQTTIVCPHCGTTLHRKIEYRKQRERRIAFVNKFDRIDSWSIFRTFTVETCSEKGKEKTVNIAEVRQIWNSPKSQKPIFIERNLKSFGCAYYCLQPFSLYSTLEVRKQTNLLTGYEEKTSENSSRIYPKMRFPDWAGPITRKTFPENLSETKYIFSLCDPTTKEIWKMDKKELIIKFFDLKMENADEFSKKCFIESCRSGKFNYNQKTWDTVVSKLKKLKLKDEERISLLSEENTNRTRRIIEQRYREKALSQLKQYGITTVPEKRDEFAFLNIIKDDPYTRDIWKTGMEQNFETYVHHRSEFTESLKERFLEFCRKGTEINCFYSWKKMLQQLDALDIDEKKKCWYLNLKDIEKAGYCVNKRYTAEFKKKLKREFNITRLPRFYRFDIKDFYEDIKNDPHAETIWKNGNTYLYNEYIAMNNEMKEKIWQSIKIAFRHQYKIQETDIWLDLVKLVIRLNMDHRSPKYICPENMIKMHDKLQIIYNRNQERIRKEEKNARELALLKTLSQEDKNYRKRISPFEDLIIKSNDLTIKVLPDIPSFKKEADAMHHCVFSNRYYEKQTSLILSARDKNNKRVETIEYDLNNQSVIQSRAIYNGTTPFHNEILQLMNEYRNAINIRYEKACQVYG